MRIQVYHRKDQISICLPQNPRIYAGSHYYGENIYDEPTRAVTRYREIPAFERIKVIPGLRISGPSIREIQEYGSFIVKHLQIHYFPVSSDRGVLPGKLLILLLLCIFVPLLPLLQKILLITRILCLFFQLAVGIGPNTAPRRQMLLQSPRKHPTSPTRAYRAYL